MHTKELVGIRVSLSAALCAARVEQGSSDTTF